MIKKTAFFRGSQMALSENAAKELFIWYDKTRCKTSAQIKRRVYVLECTKRRVTPNEDGYEDSELGGGEYELSRIVDHDISKKKVTYRVRWMKGGKEDSENRDTWEPRRNLLQNADVTLAAYYKEFKLKESEIKRIEELEAKEEQSAAAIARQKKKIDKEKQKREQKSKIEKSFFVSEEQQEKALELANEKRGRTPASFFTLWVPLPAARQALKERPGVRQRDDDDSRLFYEELVMTKRKGKFTEKVKAIRALLLEHAHDDPELMNLLVKKETPFSEKRQMRFAMDHKFDYTGKPWFSLQTSVAEPNTEMLHTMTCRNMLDTKEINDHLRNEEDAPRNFADFDVFVWDFDLIIKHRIFINARFRFCKECKEYSSTSDLKKSGNAVVDRAVQRHIRHDQIRATSPSPPARQIQVTGAASRPTRTPAVVAAAASRIPAVVAVPTVHTEEGAESISTVSAQSTEYTLKSIPKSHYPLTDLVSYFALRASMIDLTRS